MKFHHPCVIMFCLENVVMCSLVFSTMPKLTYYCFWFGDCIAVTATLLNFIRLFRKAHEENCKQAELEKKKALKEAEMEKAKGVNLTKKSAKDS